MEQRGTRLIRRGWPLGAALLILVVVAWPRPVNEGSGPSGSGSPTSGPLGTALAVARGTGVPASGQPTAPASLGPGVSADASTEPTSAATAGPTVRPTALSTARPTPLPTPHPQPTPRPTPGPTPAPVPPLSACSIFPSSNVWNRRVDGLPVAANSATMIGAIGLDASLHPDFSAAGGYGIPFNVVASSTPRSKVSFRYAGESDPGPYPIPSKPRIEGGSDRHLLMIDTNACTLYELYAAANGSSGWQAGSGAIWNLGSNKLRPPGWTSADAAGLPIFPGLVRYSEVAAGAIRHAIRFTAPQTCAGYIYPARHEAGSGACTGSGASPPMGLRVRLKASVNISAFGPQSRIILTALQRYGMLLADNGSPWYITGAPDSRWNDDELHHLGGLSGADFEVVDTTGLVNG